jgi:hypothetical protein
MPVLGAELLNRHPPMCDTVLWPEDIDRESWVQEGKAQPLPIGYGVRVPSNALPTIAIAGYVLLIGAYVAPTPRVSDPDGEAFEGFYIAL